MDSKAIKKILIVIMLIGLNIFLFSTIKTYLEKTQEIRIQIQEEEQAIKVAFFGDATVHRPHGRGVYELAKRENAEMIIMTGDIVNDESPEAAGEWNAMVNEILGENFPLVSAIGNHDRKYWGTYPPFLNERITKAGPNLKCEGEVGVNMLCTYKDRIQVVLSGVGTMGTGHEVYAKNSFAKSKNINWKVCAFHKVQRLMQVGGKVDEVGWWIYDECRIAGAIVATGHEHSYARTHLMSDFDPQVVVSNSPNLVIEKGKTFAFTVGTGGHSLRDTEDGLERNPWWAKTYTEDNENATYGALFCNFKKSTADCYFKNIRNEVIDAFTLESRVADPTPVPTPTPIATPIPSISASPTPIVSVSPTPSPMPTGDIDIALTIVDLDKDMKPTINDFVLFAGYYNTNNCLIDYDKDGDCRDISDFHIFASYYLQEKEDAEVQ